MSEKLMLRLERKWQMPDYTIGVLLIDGIYCCNTLELPWRNNEPQISCIPKGLYKIKLWKSPHFKMLLPKLLNVPERTDILLHPANYPKELKGCIAVGRNTIKGGLTDSRFYCNLIVSLMKDHKEITISIV